MKGVVFGAAGLIALIAALLVFAAREPRYDGRPVSYWIEELTGDEPEKAHAALLAIGERAIPRLLDALKTEPSWSPSEFLDQVSAVPLVGRIADRMAERRNRREQIPDAAAEVLEGLATHANRFVPELVKIYQDPKRSEEVIERAAGLLADLGPTAGSAMPSYLAHLRGPDLAHKHLTVSILAAIGPPATKAVPLLTGLFNGEQSNDLIVADALWTIDRRTNEALQASLRALQARHRRVDEGSIRRSLELLTRMGPAARPATPVLRELFRRADTIRLPIEVALRSIDVAELRQAYSEANQTARQWIEKTVAALGKQDLRTPTPDRTNFFRALSAMSALGPEAKAAVPRLVELMTEALPHRSYGPEGIHRVRLQTRAAQALGEIGDASDTVVAALIRQLQTNSMVAQACCEALGRLGPPARAAVPDLLRMLDASDRFLRLAAAMALVQIAPDTGRTIVPALRDLETVPDLRIQNAARIARWKIEPEGPSPVENLLSGSMTDFYYLDKIKLLGWLGPEAKTALPVLIGIVTTNSLTQLRVRAAEAIRRIDAPTYDQMCLPGPLALPGIAIE